MKFSAKMNYQVLNLGKCLFIISNISKMFILALNVFVKFNVITEFTDYYCSFILPHLEEQSKFLIINS